MFDYAISQNRGQRPKGRILTSCIASFILHVLLLAVLIEYPQLLQGGMLSRFRAIALLTEGPGPKEADEDQNWRTVAILRTQSRMEAPTAEQLKKLLYDWQKKESRNESPPIRIRWGNEQRAALNAPPPAVIRPESKAPAPIINLPSVTEQAAKDDHQPSGGNSPESAPGSPVAIRAESSNSDRDTVHLPAPGPPPKIEAASNVAPNSIPQGIKKPEERYRVFEDEQKALHSPESGLFDTKGFPLGEYANLIKERIKQKWNIPSHLQNFQGHTTVIFYIDKNGRYGNARIVKSSGSTSFDIAALMAVIESDPFPPLPKGFPGNRIGAKFVLSWNEP